MANQSNYWDRRTLELQNSIALHEQALFQNLQQYYNKEAAELDQDIAAYYSKYGTNNVIQYRNLLQSLSDADKQLLYEKIKDFEQKYPQYAHLMPVRESIYKLDRLEGLRTSVAIQQLKMGAYEIAQAQAHFQQMALLSGNFIAEKMGYGSSFYRIDSDMLRLVVGQDWCNNQDFSARIWNNRNALTQTLQTQIVNGMIRGDSYKAISKSVQNKFQTVSQRNIERLVFTEDTFLANEAAMQTYLNDPDYAYYEYVALCDGKTCDLCASLTGERFRISERRPGTNFPPLHPWCRCFFDIVYEKNSGKYTERDSENSRNCRQTGLTASRKNGTINLGKNYGERRKQIAVPYDDEISESELPEFNRNAFESIMEETGYEQKEAKKFHNALIEWFGEDYENFTAGNRKEQERIINKGLARMGAYDGTIWRGMSFKEQEKSEYHKIAALAVGEIIPAKSVYAWSSEKDVAKNYSAMGYDSKDSILLICETNKSGVGMQHVSKFGQIEAEILAPSTTRYEIVEKQVINKYDYLVQDIKSSNLSLQKKEERLAKLFKNKMNISKYSITIFRVKEV